MRKLLVFAAAMALAACNPFAQMDMGEGQVEAFHERYSSGDFDAIYSETGEPFREVTSRADFAELMQWVSGTLGAVESTERSGFNVNSEAGIGTTTVINMSTVYEQGEGEEVFTFLGSGEDMRLIGWEVLSDQLANTPMTPAAEPDATPAASPGDAKPAAPVPASGPTDTARSPPEKPAR